MPFTPPPAFDDLNLPRPADPVADDIAARNPDSGDISAGEQVLDEGRVTPEPDDFENGDETTDSGGEESTDSDGDTSADRAHAADERTDPGAPPAQSEPA